MSPSIPPLVRRVIVALAILITVLILAGATYQGVATALERREFQRPGGLVDVGGFQLHIYCAGEGSPAVVLEAAAGGMSPAWGWVQPEVARVTRVCSYDRAGLGWSESRDGRYEPSYVPGDLHALLDAAGERGPFVVVGDELGAAFARMFAAEYPAQTAALVLVDDPVAAGNRATGTAVVGAWPWLARAGILRATGRLSSRAIALPGKSGGAMRAFLNRPDHLTRAAMEISRRSEAEGAARAARLDPSLAITFVTIGHRSQPAMLATREEAALVTRAIEATVTRVREASISPSPEP